MKAFIHHTAHRSDIGRDAGGGFVMGDKDRLDRPRFVAPQSTTDFLHGARRAPSKVNQFYIQTQFLRHLSP